MADAEKLKTSFPPYLRAMLTHFVFSIPSEERALWRRRVMSLGEKQQYFALLENQGEPFAPSWIAEGLLAGIGAKQVLKDKGAFFSQLKNARFSNPLMGYLGYDLKNQVEKLHSQNSDKLGTPDACLFEPYHFIKYDGKELSISSYGDAKEFFEELATVLPKALEETPKVTLEARMSEENYLKKVAQVIDYIKQGEVYELNLCMEYFAENVKIHAPSTYEQLMQRSEVPFAAYLKLDDIHTLCASPERFLKNDGGKLLSQPIKGTRKRGATKLEDEALKEELLHSEKDRAENVMIVDLVRNDLTRSCEYGSIEVEELFGIYSFTNVHQMISTVSGSLRKDVHWSDAIKYAFPVGSMTGAPKIRAMQLIEELELSKRGIYSGSIGIIYPNGDFDLNVVIRSVMYNEKDSYLSVQAGGAITYDSKAEEEFEEIQIKLSNIRKLFEKPFIHKITDK